MKRKDMYYVGGEEARFTKDECEVLHEALASFGNGYYHHEEYLGSPRSLLERDTFYVTRADRKYFRKDELEALYWFFRGVMVANHMALRGNQQ